MGAGVAHANKAVGAELAAIISSKSWWTQRHLVLLNFCIISLVLFSSSNGYDGSMMNGLLALPSWNEFMNHPTGAWLGFINAIYSLGNAVSLPVCAWSANRFGRKVSVYAGLAFIVLGTVTQSVAHNEVTFVLARLFLGLGSGFFTAVPLLITETAYPSHRGIATSLYNCGWYVGSIVAAWTTFGTRNIATSWCWRIPSVLQALCPLLAIPGFLLSSESPRWLVSVGRAEEARQVLAKIHAGGDETDPLVNYEMLEIEATLKAEREAKETSSYLDMFRTKGNRHRLLISVSLGIFGQWVGNGVVSYYLALILASVGITSVTHQTLISGCLQIWNFLWAIAAAVSVDKLGRRTLFLASGCTMLVSYIVVTGLSGSFAQTGHASTGVAVIPFLFIFFGGYDIALTPLLVSYPCEIWTYNLRARGVAVTFMSTLLAVFFNIFINPIALGAIQWKYYFVFIVVLVLMIVTVYFYYPETRGRSLEQITYIFDGDDAIAPPVSQTVQRANSVAEDKRSSVHIERVVGINV